MKRNSAKCEREKFFFSPISPERKADKILITIISEMHVSHKTLFQVTFARIFL